MVHQDQGIFITNLVFDGERPVFKVETFAAFADGLIDILPYYLPLNTALAHLTFVFSAFLFKPQVDVVGTGTFADKNPLRGFRPVEDGEKDDAREKATMEQEIKYSNGVYRGQVVNCKRHDRGGLLPCSELLSGW